MRLTTWSRAAWFFFFVGAGPYVNQLPETARTTLESDLAAYTMERGHTA